MDDAKNRDHTSRLSSQRMSENGILFLHLAGVLLFVGGSVAAAVLRRAAMTRERPSEIALLLRAVRPAVPVVAGGLVLAIAAGFWLAHRLDYALSQAWLSLTFALIAWMLVVGAAAGRQDRHTRELAERLAADGDAPDDDLARRLRDPLNLALNASMLVAVVAVVALMIWKPGA
jgi:uncharacterized membrane protein